MATLEQRMQVIKLIILDVDGVMTDDTVIYSEDGYESKGFNTQYGAKGRAAIAWFVTRWVLQQTRLYNG